MVEGKAPRPGLVIRSCQIGTGHDVEAPHVEPRAVDRGRGVVIVVEFNPVSRAERIGNAMTLAASTPTNVKPRVISRTPVGGSRPVSPKHVCICTQGARVAEGTQQGNEQSRAPSATTMT